MNIVEKETTMKWYVVRAQSNRERSIGERLTNEGAVGDLMGKLGRVIVPIENSFYLKNGKKVKREKVKFPGYIFIETNAVGELKYFLKGMNGAQGFLTNRTGDILPLTQLEVDRMIGEQKRVLEEVEVEVKFIAGEEVQILEGPFNTFTGKIEQVSGDKVKIAVSVF